MSRSLNSLFVLLPAALVAVSIGCGSSVTGGGGIEEGVEGEHFGCGGHDEDVVEDGEDGSDGEDGTEPAPELTSLVIERDGLALLQFASFELSCDEEGPALPDCRSTEDFLLEVEMPASYLVPGVVELSDPAVFMFTQARGAAEDDGLCYSGGGGSGFGSMTIHEVADGSLRVTIDGAFLTDAGGLDASVDFDVLRCSQAGPQGSFAIGFPIDMGWDQPADDSFTTTYQAGGEPQEDRFVIQIADHDRATCDNPYASPSCPAASRSASVSIPMSMLVIGATLDLSSPDIFVSFSEQGPNEGADDCWFGGGGGVEAGTMTIVAAGQGTLDVSFTGTSQVLLDGSHTIPVCD